MAGEKEKLQKLWDTPNRKTWWPYLVNREEDGTFVIIDVKCKEHVIFVPLILSIVERAAEDYIRTFCKKGLEISIVEENRSYLLDSGEFSPRYGDLLSALYDIHQFGNVISDLDKSIEEMPAYKRPFLEKYKQMGRNTRANIHAFRGRTY